MSTVLNVCAAGAGMNALAQRVHDTSIPLEERWAHLSVLHSASKIARDNVQDPSRTEVPLRELPSEHAVAWMRPNNLMNQALGEESPYRQAFTAPCVSPNPPRGCIRAGQTRDERRGKGTVGF